METQGFEVLSSQTRKTVVTMRTIILIYVLQTWVSLTFIEQGKEECG